MPLLFSYGSLQQTDVQHRTFGRLLEGMSDELCAFERTTVRIDDPTIAATIGRTHHDNVVFNGDTQSVVRGVAFEITSDELTRVDGYEATFAYVRRSATLASGREAWVYLHSGSA